MSIKPQGQISSFVSSAYYMQGLNTEIIKNSWSFVVFYGFAIAFGWHHYIERLDDKKIIRSVFYKFIEKLIK